MVQLPNFEDQIHDHLNETLAEVARQGYDIAPPTQQEYWRIDELAEIFNRSPHLTCRNAVYALGVDVIQEEKAGILNWLVKGRNDFERDVAKRIQETGETHDEAADYLFTMMTMKLAREFDKMRDSNPSTFEAVMTTFRRMFAEFGRPVPYPFNG